MLLDGRAVNDFDSLKTTIGVAAVTPAWNGQTRITPHDPAHSLLFDLITHRGKSQQMPPIASTVVDQADVPLLEAWIAQMAAPANGGSGGGSVGGAGGVSGGGGSGGGRGGASGSSGTGGSAGSSGGTGGSAGSAGGTGGSSGTATGAGDGGRESGGTAADTPPVNDE